MEREVRNRRTEELEALQAYYGNDLQRSLRDDDGSRIASSSPASSALSSPPPPPPPPMHTPESDDDDSSTVEYDYPLEGPWFLRIRHADKEDDNDFLSGGNNSNGNNTSNNSSLGTPTLEIRLPSCYPLGEACPEPILHNVMMKPQLKQQFLKELRDMYEIEMDVGIMWGERCREELLSDEIMTGVNNEQEEHNSVDNCCNDDDDDDDTTNTNNSNDIVTFIPPTTRYHQPIRHFPAHIIANPTLYSRPITHTPPFHPPKSGPSEIMIAHVCHVTCMEHVQWALSELLFNDKKVGKATHNMFAYRFTSGDNNNGNYTHFSDNDDDGEKGSGSKLASLLEMCRVDNVFVVVSRWFGGMKLGPARFKWIAGVARDGLVQGGFLLK